jgi:hypothetical protein
MVAVVNIVAVHPRRLVQISVRSYLTAGVALAGASAIAITPISPITAAAPDALMSRAAVSTASVQLSAFSNPFTPYVDLVGNTIGNVGYMANSWFSQPFPLLSQVASNQLGYAEQYVTAMTGFVKGMAEWATGTGADPYGSVPWGLKEAADALRAGDLMGVMTALNTSFTMMFLGGPINLMGLLQIPVDISKNVTKALEAVYPMGVMFAGLGFLQNVIGVNNSIGASAQAIFDAVRAGDPLGAMSEVIDMPAKVLNALINGYSNGFVTLPGLISSGANGDIPGLLTSLLVNLPQAIAAAIKPPAPAPRAPLADVASLPAATAMLVSLEASPAPAINAPKVEVEPESATPAPETTVDTPATTPVVEVTAPEVAPAASAVTAAGESAEATPVNDAESITDTVVTPVAGTIARSRSTQAAVAPSADTGAAKGSESAEAAAGTIVRNSAKAAPGKAGTSAVKPGADLKKVAKSVSEGLKKIAKPSEAKASADSGSSSSE